MTLDVIIPHIYLYKIKHELSSGIDKIPSVTAVCRALLGLYVGLVGACLGT